MPFDAVVSLGEATSNGGDELGFFAKLIQVLDQSSEQSIPLGRVEGRVELVLNLDDDFFSIHDCTLPDIVSMRKRWLDNLCYVRPWDTPSWVSQDCGALLLVRQGGLNGSDQVGLRKGLSQIGHCARTQRAFLIIPIVKSRDEDNRDRTTIGP